MFDNDGRSALHLAAECGSMEVETEFKIFNQNATFVHHEVCKLLLNKNAFVNSKTKLGWTALHFAANKVRKLFCLKNIKKHVLFSTGLHRPGRVPHQIWRHYRSEKENNLLIIQISLCHTELSKVLFLRRNDDQETDPNAPSGPGWSKGDLCQAS